MKTFIKSAPAFLLVLASSAYAQPPSIDGTWTGHATASNGTQVRIAMTLAGAGGKLRLSPSPNYYTVDPCYDRDIPVAVEKSDAGLAINVKGESVLKGCLNEVVKLKTPDPKTLTGTLKDGRTIILARK